MEPHAQTFRRSLRLQLWSYNYDPEPTGIAPISRVWARAMQNRGHDVLVVAAHPHYPEPRWGSRLKPYRERRNGVSVLRLPLWTGRQTPIQRVRQEASFAASLSAASPLLPTPDVIVAVSPSFPALLPTMLHARLRRIPWVLWLQDILPDGAAVTGLLDESSVTVRAARSLERAAYRSARKVVVISETFEENLRPKRVPQEKLVRIYNPASRPVAHQPPDRAHVEPNRVLTMGNIGHSQGLTAFVKAFEASESLTRKGATFVMAGDGVAGDEVRSVISAERVRVTGILDDAALEEELRKSAVAVVSQRYDGAEFNVPSKLMNFMGFGLPVVASVGSRSEVARILKASGGGWPTDSARPEEAARVLAEVLDRPDELDRRGRAALEFARRNFAPDHIAEQFEDTLLGVLADRP